jgi:DNA-binding IclR family transcriptional regulator
LDFLSEVGSGELSVQLDDILTQYVSFLKIKGRFRDIGYEDQDDKSTKVVAEPFFPEMPKIEAHVSSEKMVVDVIGSNSEHLRIESVQFFEMSGMVLEKVITQVALPKSIKVSVEGLDNDDYIAVRDAIQSTIEDLQLELEEQRIGLIFGLKPRVPVQMPKQKLSRTEMVASIDDLRPTEIRRRDIKITEPRKPIIIASKAPRPQVTAAAKPAAAPTSAIEEKAPIEKSGLAGLNEHERLVLEAIAARPKQKAQSNLISKSISLPQETVRRILQQLVSKELLRVQAGWYVLDSSEIASIEQSALISPLSQDTLSTPLTDADRLLTASERKVIEAIRHRPNQKAQSNLLTKPTKLDQNTLKSVLRSLVRKNFLDMKYGWYSIKQNAIFDGSSSSDSLGVDSTVHAQDLELEEAVLASIAAQPNKKTQAKLLAKKLKVAVDKIRRTLDGLAAQGRLSERRGWFTLVDSSVSDSDSFDASAKLIIDAIRARPSGRAQSHLLVKPTGLAKDHVRSILKTLVKNGVLECKHGWYQLTSGT